jgi:predicted PurR-regulated permease PerM
VNDVSTPVRALRHDVAAWLIAGGSLWLVLHVHLLPALLAGLLVFQLVNLITPLIRDSARLNSDRAKIIAVVMLTTIMVLILVAIGVGLALFFQRGADGLPVLMEKMAEILESRRGIWPTWLVASLPADAQELQAQLIGWLRKNTDILGIAGAELGRALVLIIIGLVMGAMIALRGWQTPELGPLGQSLAERVLRISDAFRRIVFAQVRISTLNTFFTLLYLGVALPLLGIDIPLTKTLIVLTFVCGLLPIIGNLISNTVITIVCLSHSIELAAVSLGYLILIHKLEYFLNAHIVGTQIRARAWELLLAMIVGEGAYGIAGLIAAPIYYAYLKDELVSRRLI